MTVEALKIFFGLIFAIGGFHVMQVSLIITQVQNRVPFNILSQEIEIS